VASAPAEAVAVGGGPEVQASLAVSSVRVPFASLLGEESSDAEAPGDGPAREAIPALAKSPAREASPGGGSPPKDMQEESSDEAESASVRRIKRAEAPPCPAGDGINSLYIGSFLCCCFLFFCLLLLSRSYIIFMFFRGCDRRVGHCGGTG